MSKKPLTWLTTSLAVALVVGTWTVLGVVWAAAGDRAALIEGQADHHARLDDHEGRLRTMETALAEIGVDVRWIRDTLARRQEAEP
jgi:hypothetical protein